MDFFKLRFINVLFLFVIGISIGFLWGKKGKDSKSAQNEYKPVYSQITPDAVYLSPSSIQKESVKNSYPNPMDDDEDYQLSVVGDNLTEEEPLTAQKKKESQAVRQDNSSDFFSSPSSFYGKEVYVRIQMITARKSEKGWRINSVYSDSDKNLSYLYIDDPDMISGEKPDFRVGYYYKVLFFCDKGELKNGNRLISIESTGEKTPWASGISALE
ncbi:MAG: hypothetical protein GX447_03905 [Elusimicrobia bacterium]|nr:hypothetical protein [Elusimicrobiota bacterium]